MQSMPLMLLSSSLPRACKAGLATISLTLDLLIGVCFIERGEREKTLVREREQKRAISPSSPSLFTILIGTIIGDLSIVYNTPVTLNQPNKVYKLKIIKKFQN
jgi:hypothetical protein